jgi:hypothetical protein
LPEDPRLLDRRQPAGGTLCDVGPIVVDGPFLTRFRRGRRFDRVALHRLRRGIGTSRVLGVAFGDSVRGTARTECTLALRSRRPSEEHADRDEREHDENESHAELHLVGRPLSSSE